MRCSLSNEHGSRGLITEVKELLNKEGTVARYADELYSWELDNHATWGPVLLRYRLAVPFSRTMFSAETASTGLNTSDYH